MDKLKLLLLEDEVFDADLIQRVLKLAGMDCDCTVVSGRADFTHAIQNDTYDVILSDNKLPQFDAESALQLTKEHNIHIPFILVTGSVSEDFAVSMMKKGVSDYILKDRLQRLPSAIQSAIEKQALETVQQKNIENLVRNEALLKRSERLARLGSWEMDNVAHTTYWSDERYRLLGYEPGDVEASLKNFLDRVHPDDREYVQQTIEHTIRELNDNRYNCRIICNNGTLKYHENELFVERDAAGKVTRMNGFSRDVTERRLAENRMHRSEANLQTIFDNTDTGYALLDSSLRLISYNLPIYRFSVEQLAKPLEEGLYAVEFFRPDRIPFITATLENALKGITTSYEVPYSQPDGTVKWFEMSCHPVLGNERETIGIIMSELEITKRKELELQGKLITSDLILRNNALEQFAYIVSHNLRGPVATIIGISNLMKADELTEEEKEYFIDGLHESVKKLDEIVIDLSKVIQLKNSLNEHKEEVLFSEIFYNVIAGLDIADDGSVTITTDFAQATGISTLKSYIHSIFYNLISNSLKYRQPTVPVIINISSKRSNGKTRLTFKDNGMGIDLQKRGEQVFGMYQRFHTKTTEGKGLGLFMVRSQVEALGGSISIKSEVDKGTEFVIEL